MILGVEKKTQHPPEAGTRPLSGQAETSRPVLETHLYTLPGLATGTPYKTIKLYREFREIEARIWPALLAPPVSLP